MLPALVYLDYGRPLLLQCEREDCGIFSRQESPTPRPAAGSDALAPGSRFEGQLHFCAWVDTGVHVSSGS